MIKGSSGSNVYRADTRENGALEVEKRLRESKSKYDKKNPEVHRRSVAKYTSNNQEVHRQAVANYSQAHPEVHRDAVRRSDPNNEKRKVRRNQLWFEK